MRLQRLALQLGYLLQIAGFAVSYMLAGRMGVLITVSDASISPFWPPIGLALVVLLVRPSLWPGMIIGAFGDALLSGVPPLIALYVALTSLFYMLSAVLLRRFVGYRPSLDRLRDTVGLIVISAVLCPVLNALCGVLLLAFSGLLAWSDIGRNLLIWWVGDVIGVLVVAPLLLTWFVMPRQPLSRARLLEAGLLLLALGLYCQLVFSGLLDYSYLIFPFIIWAALRFDPRIATTAVLVIVTIAIWNTAAGFGPFVANSRLDSLTFLQTFIAAASVMGLLLAALTAERRRNLQSFRFLAEASRQLAASLDYAETLESAARLAVPVLADWCFVYIVEADGSTRRVRATHANPDHAQIARQLLEQYGVASPESPDSILHRALYLGQPELIHEIDDAWLQRVTRDANHLALVRQLNAVSLIVVPLVSHEHPLGAIVLLSAQAGHRYRDDDLALAENLAARAAQAIDHARLFSERTQAESALLDSETRYRQLFENSPISLWEQDFSEPKRSIDQLKAEGVSDFRSYFAAHPQLVRRLNGAIRTIDVNQATLLLYQARDKAELLTDLQPLLDEGHLDTDSLLAMAEGHLTAEVEGMNRTLKHELLVISVRWTVVPGYEDTWSKVIVSVIDLTQRKRLESQLLQAQKMESIGRLAGGIAHDFNNMLTAILGYTDLVKASLDPDATVQADLDDIRKASERAARLTNQLLAFASRQQFEPRDLNLNDLIVDMRTLLRRLIGEDIELITLTASDLGYVRVDVGQIEQVLVNLAVNARDAMPQGGQLTIATQNMTIDLPYASQHSELAAGHYSLLTVSDTGVGMSQAVREHIFEPFFTTKPRGKGTGLGLSTSYGIVKQSGGHIAVESEPDQGTTFSIYLPQVTPRSLPAASPLAGERLPHGTETVLLVEDELAVREMTARVLRSHGYAVLEASNGEEALRLLRKRPNAMIDLLLSDMVMPVMGGWALAEQVTRQRPSVRVLFISGYSETAIERQNQFNFSFLPKPFSTTLLVQKVREVLDAEQEVAG